MSEHTSAALLAVQSTSAALLAIRLVVSLAFVLGMIGLAAWTLKRKGFLGRIRSKAGAPVEVLHRSALNRSASLAVVRVGQRVMVMGVTEKQVNLLAEVPELLEEMEQQERLSSVARERGGEDDPLDVDVFDELEMLEVVDGTRRTGSGAVAVARPATPARMSFVEALRELTVRRS